MHKALRSLNSSDRRFTAGRVVAANCQPWIWQLRCSPPLSHSARLTPLDTSGFLSILSGVHREYDCMTRSMRGRF